MIKFIVNTVYAFLWALFLSVLAVINIFTKAASFIVNGFVAGLFFICDHIAELFVLFVLGGFIYSLVRSGSNNTSDDVDCDEFVKAILE